MRFSKEYSCVFPSSFFFPFSNLLLLHTFLNSLSQAYYGSTECAELLLLEGADKNVKMHEGETLVQLAQSQGNLETASLIAQFEPQLKPAKR